MQEIKSEFKQVFFLYEFEIKSLLGLFYLLVSLMFFFKFEALVVGDIWWKLAWSLFVVAFLFWV